MELALIVYVISILEPLKTFFWMSVTLIIIFGLPCLIIGTLECKLSYSSAKSWIIRITVVMSFFGFIAALIPSERTAYMMIGAYAAQKVAEQPRTIELSNKVLKIIEKKLDDALVDVTKETKAKIEPSK